MFTFSARRAAVVAAVAALVAVLSLATPPSAQADRCQPEEFVGPALTSEANSPVCVVMLDVVYPALSCDRSTLMGCLQTLDAVATARNAPANAAATPARAVGAAGKMPGAVSGARYDLCARFGPQLNLSDQCRPVR
jgi:hypothetical protein